MPNSRTIAVPMEQFLYWHSTLKGLAINPSMRSHVGADRYTEIAQSVLQMESIIDDEPANPTEPRDGNLIPWPSKGEHHDRK